MEVSVRHKIMTEARKELQDLIDAWEMKLTSNEVMLLLSEEIAAEIACNVKTERDRAKRKKKTNG